MFPFGRRYLDFSFRASWSGLDAGCCWEEQERILGDLRALVRHSIPAGTLDYGVLSGDPERWDTAILTLAHDKASGSLIATMARHRHVFSVGTGAGFDEERFVITDSRPAKP